MHCTSVVARSVGHALFHNTLLTSIVVFHARECLYSRDAPVGDGAAPTAKAHLGAHHKRSMDEDVAVELAADAGVLGKHSRTSYASTAGSHYCQNQQR